MKSVIFFFFSRIIENIDGYHSAVAIARGFWVPFQLRLFHVAFVYSGFFPQIQKTCTLGWLESLNRP